MKDSTIWIIFAMSIGLLVGFTLADDKQLANQQDAHYKNMVCLHKADIQRGIKPIEAIGWPDYLNKNVECD